MSIPEIDLSKTINPYTVWDDRARIPGLRSVMSLGFQEREAEVESAKLVDSVFHFLEGQVEGKDVLEIGSGIGRFTQPLSQLTASLVTIDLSQEMLQRAKAAEPNTAKSPNYLQASATHIPTSDKKFDLVFEATVLLHMPDEEFRLILEESKRVLRADGKLFFCGPINPKERRQIHQYVVHRTIEEYQQALKPFKIQSSGNVACGKDNYSMLIAS